MTASITITAAETFTLAHARRIASKVATDLLRFQTLYRSPSTVWIDKYETEMVELLRHDGIKNVVYGFKRDGKWTEAAVRYKALPGGILVADDDPGKIRPRLDVAGASFTSFLSYSGQWFNLPAHQRVAIERKLPFQRSFGESPPLETGHWSDDLNYYAGGRGLGRSTVRR
ncbi:MAG: hypothetical protein GY769_08380 [bacterium]|nr:hypothetical protein [bacterium]